MRKLFVIIFCLISVNAYPAELLIKANSHWMDGLSQSDIDNMTPSEKQSYDARSQKGDIIVVRPDGWKWGKEERPPRFVVVKLKGVKEADVKHYEQTLMDNSDPEKPVMLKCRKYAVDTLTVDSCVSEVGGAKEIAKEIFDTKLITKTK